ncbi:MAG: class I SAM-dependent methyltransferase [Methanosarcinaceae archaeon]|nr:class I SAM-dependent methyltransferase [Methanosarcinaceae archaeon]
MHSLHRRSHFSAWEKEHVHVDWGGSRSTSEVRSNLRPGQRILDAGCGKGRYLLPLTDSYDICGTDVSLTALHATKERLNRRDRNAPLMTSSITHLPLAGRSFDAILCYGVMQHLLSEERHEAAAEFERILTPGGLVFFEAFGIQDMRYGGEKVEQDTFLRRNGVIYHYFTKEEVINLFGNFEMVTIRDTIWEKRFRGRPYLRHMVNAVFRLPDQNAMPR